jgi:hypothetical protein
LVRLLEEATTELGNLKNEEEVIRKRFGNKDS